MTCCVLFVSRNFVITNSWGITLLEKLRAADELVVDLVVDQAKAKDQGLRRKSSPKKNGSQKNLSIKKGLQNFFSDFQKKRGLQKTFSADLQKNKRKKRVFRKFSRRSPKEENKIGLRKFSARFLAFSNKILTVQKILLSSSRGQANFRGLEASTLRPRT